MSEESTYITVPVSDKDGRSRDLYGNSDTVGGDSTKARSMETLKLTLVPTKNRFQILVNIRCLPVSATHVEIILQKRKER